MGQKIFNEKQIILASASGRASQMANKKEKFKYKPDCFYPPGAINWDMLAKKTIWIKEKPDVPCLFAHREKWKDYFSYEIYELRYLDTEEGKYLAIICGDGEEFCDYEDFEGGEYFIIETYEDLL